MQKWQKTRQKGKLRFVIIYGVIGFGLLLSIAQLATKYILHHPHLDLKNALFLFGINLIIGALFGLFMWHSAEIKYRRAEKQYTSRDE